MGADMTLQSAFELTIEYREQTYGPIIVAAFEERALPPAWGLAIARVESTIKPKARNLDGGDGRRGGAWGMCQVTFKTAQGLGYTGLPEGLLDPTINAQLCAKLVRQLSDRWGGAVEDVIAAYNSGRPKARAPQTTVRDYLPRVMQWIRYYELKKPWERWPKAGAAIPNGLSS